MRSEKPCNPAAGYCLHMKSAGPHLHFASAVPCDRVHDVKKRRLRNCTILLYKGDPGISLNNEWNAGIFVQSREDLPGLMGLYLMRLQCLTAVRTEFAAGYERCSAARAGAVQLGAAYVAEIRSCRQLGCTLRTCEHFIDRSRYR